MTPTLRKQTAVRFAALALAVAAAFVGPARADAVRVNGIWQPGCRVVGSDGVVLRYVDPQGRDRRRPLTEVQGVRLDAYPDYHDGVDLVQQGQDLLALRPLKAALAAAQGREEWLAADVAERLAALHDRAGDGAAAASVYLSSAARNPAAAFLDTPPLTSVAALPEALRTALRPRLARVLRDTSDPAAAVSLELLEQSVVTGNAPETPADADAPRQRLPLAIAVPRTPDGPAYPADAAVLLPQRLPRSPAADLLMAGEPDAAAAAADAALVARLSDEALFLRGVARLQSAQRSSSVAGHKDAALDFLRVVTLFPKSAYAGPALVEAARALLALREPEAAAALLEEARPRLNPQDAPRYHSLRNRMTAEP